MSRSSNKRVRKSEFVSHTFVDVECEEEDGRRKHSKRATEGEELTPELEPTASTSSRSPIDCDLSFVDELSEKAWWYSSASSTLELDSSVPDTYSYEGKIVIKESLENQSQNGGDDILDPSDMMALAYLEAVNNEHGALGNPEESSNNQRSDQTDTFKSVTDQTNEELFNYLSCMKTVPFDEVESGCHFITSDNVTERLGITIKEEPLLKTINDNQDATEQNELVGKYDDSLGIEGIQLDFEDIQVDDMFIKDEKVKDDISELQTPPLASPTQKLKVLDSTYFDLAFKSAIDLSNKAGEREMRYYCDICKKEWGVTHGLGSRAADTSMDEFKSHCNIIHEHDSLVLKVNTDAKGKSVTIAVEKYLGMKEKHEQLPEGMSLAKTYLNKIANTLKNIKSSFQVLSYKCYECKHCYEHVDPYIGHLTATHAILNNREAIQIAFEHVRGTFINVKSYYHNKFKSIQEYFPVISEKTNRPTYKCLQCKADFGDDKATYEAHKRNKLQCAGCHLKYFCYQFHGHIGQCEQYFAMVYPKTCVCEEVFNNVADLQRHQANCVFGINTLAFICDICKFKAATALVLHSHQAYCHTVRSDQFIYGTGGTYSPRESTIRNNTNVQSDKQPGQKKIIILPYQPEPVRILPKPKKAQSKSKNCEVINPPSRSTSKPRHFIIPNIAAGSQATVTPPPLLVTNAKTQKREDACPICLYRGTDESLDEHMLNYHSIRSNLSNDQLSILSKVFGLFRRKSEACPICPFRRTDENLDDHMVVHHLVRSDAKVVSLTRCKWCSFLGDNFAVVQHSLKNHKVSGAIYNCTCLVCCEMFTNFHSLERHRVNMHVVRSNEPVCQEVRRCTLCKALYPGPTCTHHCPLKPDLVECFYCYELFQNDLFLSCHLKSQTRWACKICNKTMAQSCIMKRHEAEYHGTGTLVYECLKCKFKEDTKTAIDSHCQYCFTAADKLHRVFLSKKVIVPTSGVSDDPKYDHSYAKKNIQVARGLAKLDYPQQTVTENLLETIEIKDKLDDIDITEYALDVLESDYDCEVASKVDNMNDNESRTINPSKVAKNTPIKTNEIKQPPQAWKIKYIVRKRNVDPNVNPKVTKALSLDRDKVEE